MARYIVVGTDPDHRWELADDAPGFDDLAQSLTAGRRAASKSTQAKSDTGSPWVQLPILRSGQRAELWISRQNLTAFALMDSGPEYEVRGDW